MNFIVIMISDRQCRSVLRSASTALNPSQVSVLVCLNLSCLMRMCHRVSNNKTFRNPYFKVLPFAERLNVTKV